MLVARPSDGEPILLDGTSSLVWYVATEWTPIDELDEILRQHFPDVSANQREQALWEIVDGLTKEALVDRR